MNFRQHPWGHGCNSCAPAIRASSIAPGLPEFKYGMVSGYLAAGLAGLEEARASGIDLDAATERLRADRNGSLYYSIYGAVEGEQGQWHPPRGTEN